MKCVYDCGFQEFLIIVILGHSLSSFLIFLQVHVISMNRNFTSRSNIWTKLRYTKKKRFWCVRFLALSFFTWSGIWFVRAVGWNAASCNLTVCTTLTFFRNINIQNNDLRLFTCISTFSWCSLFARFFFERNVFIRDSLAIHWIPVKKWFYMFRQRTFTQKIKFPLSL